MVISRGSYAWDHTRVACSDPINNISYVFKLLLISSRSVTNKKALSYKRGNLRVNKMVNIFETLIELRKNAANMLKILVFWHLRPKP